MSPKRIIVGVAGGIAAYKACSVVRQLSEAGHEVRVVPTESALRFVGAATFEALSGNPVRTGVFDDVPEVPHVRLGQQADLVLVAPATADLLARAVAGCADDLLTATLLTARCPVLFAPAMHTEMWQHPATVANVATLRERHAVVLEPAFGRLTGADTGAGRLPESEEITTFAELLLARSDALPYDLSGTKVLVTAGGTREALDPVRFIGNRSSGKQGYAVARVAVQRGADVTLIAGNTAGLADPAGVHVLHATSAAQMHEAVSKHAPDAHVLVMAAAVADYRPEKLSTQKIKKTAGDMPLRLVQNPDILAWVAAQPKAPFTVGFAAESQKLTEFADAKRRRKKVALMVANLAQHAIGADDNEVTLLDDGGLHKLSRAAKTEVARQIVAHIATLVTRRKKSGQ